MYVVEVWDKMLDDGSAERKMGRSAEVMANRAGAEMSDESNCSTLNAEWPGKGFGLCPLTDNDRGPTRASVATIRKFALRWLRANCVGHFTICASREKRALLLSGLAVVTIGPGDAKKGSWKWIDARASP
jgi:hypothetical protein